MGAQYGLRAEDPLEIIWRQCLGFEQSDLR